MQACQIKVQRVYQDEQQAEFSRSHVSVCQAELSFQDGTYIRVDGKAQIAGEDEQRYIHAGKRRESGAEENHAGGEGIQRMVQKEAVDRPLGIAHPCQCTVQTVAIPV